VVLFVVGAPFNSWQRWLVFPMHGRSLPSR
jgi:hypothetical protein